MSYFLPCLAGLLLFTSTAFPQSTFQKTYGDLSTKDTARAIVQTSDGGYCIAANARDLNTSYSDIILYRLTADGDLLWSQRIGETYDDVVTDIKETPDQGFILTGYTNNSLLDPFYSDILIIKTDDGGNLQWSTVFGGANEDRGQSIIRTNDGGYLIAGSTNSAGPVTTSAFLLKLFPSGHQDWCKTIQAANCPVNSFLRIRLTVDHGWIAGGVCTSSSGNDDYLLCKFDSSGSLQWGSTYGTASAEGFSDVNMISGNGYIIAGRSASNTAGMDDEHVFKVDANGAVVWSQNFGGGDADLASSVFQGSNGNYFVGGTTNIGSGGLLLYQLSLSELDQNGNFLWGNTYGDPSTSSESFFNFPAAGGGILLGGSTSGFSDPNNDCYLIKTDLSGNSGCFQMPFTPTVHTNSLTVVSSVNSQSVTVDESPVSLQENFFVNQFGMNCYYDAVPENVLENALRLSPVPAIDRLRIDFGKLSGEVTLRIYNVNGTLENEETKNASLPFSETDIHSLAPGIYLLSVESDGTRISKRFTKQ